MAVNFGLLNAPDIGDQFRAGMQDAENALARRQERDLRAQEVESLKQRRQAEAMESEAKARAAEGETQARRQRQEKLTQLLTQNGHRPSRELYATMAQDPDARIQAIAFQALKDMDADEAYASLLTGAPGAPSTGAAPAAPAQQPTIPADGVAPFGQPGQAPVRVQGSMTAGFDIPSAQATINRLRLSRDPRAQVTVNSLQSQIDSEYRRQDQVRTDERLKKQHDETIKDREEARRRHDQLVREGRASRGDDPSKAKFQQVDAAGNVTFFDGYGRPINTQAGAGKPSATFEKTQNQRKQLTVDLERTIKELTDVSKDGGLIDQSTGSGIGRAIDVGAGFFGKATGGAVAVGKLAPIADMVLKMVPRFEGPQSDKDTRSYKEAAGQLADATMPTKIRKEAAKEIVRLMNLRKGQFATPEMAAEGTSGAGNPNAVDTSNPLLK